jgi:hypothetical protein
VVAIGASQLAQRHVETAVFGGMTLASFIGIFTIPLLTCSEQAGLEANSKAKLARDGPERTGEPAGRSR